MTHHSHGSLLLGALSVVAVLPTGYAQPAPFHAAWYTFCASKKAMARGLVGAEVIGKK